VFSIEMKRWLRMMMAWLCYEIFLDIAEGVSEEDAPVALLEEERDRRPGILDQEMCLAGFVQFARKYASLTSREADAVYGKMNFWNIRTGITRYGDEA
jgi:hypothetical protein